jgi:hypothetical protein
MSSASVIDARLPDFFDVLRNGRRKARTEVATDRACGHYRNAHDALCSCVPGARYSPCEKP